MPGQAFCPQGSTSCVYILCLYGVGVGELYGGWQTGRKKPTYQKLPHLAFARILWLFKKEEWYTLVCQHGGNPDSSLLWS